MTSAQAIEQLMGLANGSNEAMRKAEFIVANKIALTAIELAPEETALLVDSIEITQDDTETAIEIGALHSAYVEFGTGDFAAEYVSKLPEEWRDEAIQFFINGKGHGQAHPFFYPAVQQHIPELIPELENELEKLVR